MDIHQEIIRVTSEYFQDHLDYSKLSEASKEYKAILVELCGKNMDGEEGRDNIKCDNGEALGTYWASLCLDDLIRTRQFIRGINKAVEVKIINKKPIHILYAGTGPFATLILPIIVRFSKEEIKYTLLEINPFSFKILENVISKLGLEDFNITLLNKDATKYQIDSNNEPDIIISETMQSALAKEQQVPIFLNLMSQVKNRSIFIPEKIDLYIGLKRAGVPMEELQEKDFHKEMKVFEVSRESMVDSNFPKKYTPGNISFTKNQTIIEAEKLKEFGNIVIITEIQVYKNEKIGFCESGLTTPLFIMDIPKNQERAIKINTQYKISSEPKLDYIIS